MTKKQLYLTYGAICFVSLWLLASCKSSDKNSDMEDKTAQLEDSLASTFVLHKGVNISHWLSQSDRRGGARDSFFTKSDVALIASFGYDHIRLPIDEEQMWDKQGNKVDTAFQLLHNALQWCAEYKLRTVVDLHILRSHHFNAAEKPLWTDPAEQAKFVNFWIQLSGELIKYPTDMVAYELMNEAVADDPEDWNRLIDTTFKAIRNIEAYRNIVIGSNMWQSASTFDQLRVPSGDKHIVLSFHCYEPFLFTHHQASWTAIKDYKGAINYPGEIINKKNLKGLSPELVKQLGYHRMVCTRDTLLQIIQEPLLKARELGLPLYCGEFGCLPTVPRAARLQWYTDLRSLLDENNIGWANWDYKGGFGVVDGTQKPDNDLIKALIGK